MADWAKHPINRKRYFLFKAFWIVMFLMTAGIAVYSYMMGNVFYSCFGVVFALLCAYRLLLRDRVVFNKQYKIMEQTHGASEWERIITLSDKIVARDSNTTAEYAYEQLSELVDCGEYLALGLGKGWKALYLRLSKNGFGERTAQEFTDFIKREHPHIEIRSMI